VGCLVGGENGLFVVEGVGESLFGWGVIEDDVGRPTKSLGLPKIVQELGGWCGSTDEQVVARAGAGYVEEMTFGVVDFF